MISKTVSTSKVPNKKMAPVSFNGTTMVDLTSTGESNTLNNYVDKLSTDDRLKIPMSNEAIELASRLSTERITHKSS